MKQLFISLLLLLSAINIMGQATNPIDTLTPDGAWCWFADPRALYFEGEKEQTYFSWVTNAGDIVIAAYDHTTGVFQQNTLSEKLQADDHANPAIFIRPDRRVILFYSKHFDTVMRYRISVNPEDISQFGEEKTFGNNVTYPYPFQVGSDIVILYRGDADWHPTMAVSHDNGVTFGTPQKFIVGGGQRPYTRFCQGPDGAIHCAFTTGHPRNESSNKIYYACYKNGAFYRADGTLIKNYTGSSSALNITSNEAETVYNAANGKGWIWDIAIDGSGNPVLVYAAFPSDTQHDYYYARWNGTRWENNFIVTSGSWFPQTPAGASEPEPNYSGGLFLDGDNPSVVYLSKQVNGVFEIFKYTTSDRGKTWVTEAITENTPAGLLNVRPIVPRNHKPGYFDVIWMRGTYTFYANREYHTSLVYKRGVTADNIESIELSETSIRLLEGTGKQLSATFTPFLTADKTLQWQSSDETAATVENGYVYALNKGSALITATAANDVSAVCEVIVTEPAYIENAFFDFGAAASPVAAGAIRVSDATLLNDSYGWMGAVATRDRGASQNDEERDFNMAGSPTVFRVYVPNGDYHITLKQGDKDYMHDKMTVKVNDEVKLQDITAAAGQILTNSFDVTVSGKKLDFEFSRNGSDPNWVVNSLKIEKKQGTGVQASIGIDNFSRQAMEISLSDLNGKVLYRNKSGGTNIGNFLSGKNLMKGVYLIACVWDGKRSVIKYVKWN
jgi:hypothetical protein